MKQLALLGGLKTKSKPFPSWPQWDENEEKALLDALHSGHWARGSQVDGLEKRDFNSFIERFENAICDMHEAKYAIAVASGSAALDLSVQSLGIGPGDEVIVSPYSYIACAACILRAGAKPVFTDIRYDTLNMDAAKIADSITSRTRAILVVHFAGQPADMDSIIPLAVRNGIKIIEDCAQTLGGSWNENMVGSMGDIGCFSLQEFKNITCGEGGLLLTNNEQYYRKAYSLHIAGRSFKGPWYQHEDLGWNYRITEFQAAIALCQLGRLEEQFLKRTENILYLSKLLEGVQGLEPVHIDNRVSRNMIHYFILRYKKEEWGGLSRRRFILALNAEGVTCHEGYLYPIYKNPLFEKYDECNYAAFSEKCPEAERICEEAIWFHQSLFLGDRQDMEEIAEAIFKIRKNLSEMGRNY